MRMRWEVTRRNPYYYVWWKLARAEHRGHPIEQPEDADLRQGAIAILWMIGVNGEPPDPATSFADLGEGDLANGWLSGAVHPVTMRGIAGILLAALPTDTLGHLGRIFLHAGNDDPDEESSKRQEALQQLTTANHSGLDDVLDEPIVSIDPTASERKIGDAMDLLLKQWKQARGLGDNRSRTDKFDEYLEVWDLREVWREGVYHREFEQTVREIAASTRRSTSTLNSQYGRAFELITGTAYSRELWLKMFGPIKLSDLIGLGVARTRRPHVSQSPRDVPNSVVSGGGTDSPSSTNSIVDRAQGADDADYNCLLDDIQSLMAQGRSEAEIAEELGIPLEAATCVVRLGDLSSLRPE